MRIRNRWGIVIGAVMIQLALGAIYAWSVFTRRLTDADGIYQFSAGEAAWIFSAGLATFAVVMVLAGRWLAKAGPRKMAVSGGLLLGAGYLLGGFFGSGFWTQLFFIGILGGAPASASPMWSPSPSGSNGFPIKRA